jgi:hypothetical protein
MSMMRLETTNRLETFFALFSFLAVMAWSGGLCVVAFVAALTVGATATTSVEIFTAGGDRVNITA